MRRSKYSAPIPTWQPQGQRRNVFQKKEDTENSSNMEEPIQRQFDRRIIFVSNNLPRVNILVKSALPGAGNKFNCKKIGKKFKSREKVKN